MMTARLKYCAENTPFQQGCRRNIRDILILPGGLGETDTFHTDNQTNEA